MTASTPAASLLVVDDEPDLCTLYELTLLREGYRVETATCVSEARQHLQAQRFDVLITDMRMPDGLGLDLLQDLRQQHRSERCIVVTAYGSAESAVEALRAGAFDYLTKPVDLKQLRTVVASAVQGIASGSAPSGKTPKAVVKASPKAADVPQQGNGEDSPALHSLIGESAAMRGLKQRIAKVARSMAPVLIRGESGTGKELVARALHACSQRADGALIAVNCGAIPENLLEAEFFGARKGSYTGATQDRAGFFQAARGGTLFLDEIGELPLLMQSKLLRAIQERKVRPLGATQEETVDVRIVSATHRDLAADVHSGRFRQDLYYRLNVIELPIPPLRERRGDLPLLCDALLSRIARDNGIPLPHLNETALQRIAEYPLSGNVRELENLLHRAVALSDSHELQVDKYTPGNVLDTLSPRQANTPTPQPEIPPPPSAPSAAPLEPNESHCTAFQQPHAATTDIGLGPEEPLPNDLQAWLDHQERLILMRALHDCDYNRTAAAARLGISLRQIRYRIERLHIPLQDSGNTDGASSDP